MSLLLKLISLFDSPNQTPPYCLHLINHMTARQNKQTNYRMAQSIGCFLGFFSFFFFSLLKRLWIKWTWNWDGGVLGVLGFQWSSSGSLGQEVQELQLFPTSKNKESNQNHIASNWKIWKFLPKVTAKFMLPATSISDCRRYEDSCHKVTAKFMLLATFWLPKSIVKRPPNSHSFLCPPSPKWWLLSFLLNLNFFYSDTTFLHIIIETKSISETFRSNLISLILFIKLNFKYTCKILYIILKLKKVLSRLNERTQNSNTIPLIIPNFRASTSKKRKKIERWFWFYIYNQLSNKKMVDE